MRIAVGIEYNGAPFHGWQTQIGVPTVQQSVEEALSRVADHPVRLHCSGRTDAGVHALCQVAHFVTTARRPAHGWVFGANTHLPADVSLQWAQPVPDDFHARFSALERTYRYLVLTGISRPALLSRRVTWTRRSLDAERMHSAAQILAGTHDFNAFRALGCQAKSPVRTVTRVQVRPRGGLLELSISANAFLHHMVRNIAGVLLAVGSGEA
ncbi:MAG: tRNA pseudouridine(38-40) synthase TruA, partial [Pseudomonadota bacterium]